jgi:hypothetical protein
MKPVTLEPNPTAGGTTSVWPRSIAYSAPGSPPAPDSHVTVRFMRHPVALRKLGPLTVPVRRQEIFFYPVLAGARITSKSPWRPRVLRFISMTKSGGIDNSAWREFTLIGMCGRPGRGPP